jgi:hypothetical protein
MLPDNRKLYRLAASRAGIIHEKVKRHSAPELRGGRKGRELLAGKNLGKADGDRMYFTLGAGIDRPLRLSV